MIRSSKKMRLNDASKSGYVQSGNFMTSCLHDQTEYTDEMPIASPDTLNNEVPVNTINPEQEEDINNETIKENESLNSINNSKLTTTIDKTQNSNSNIHKLSNLIAQTGSISGGLTLDRNNKSLKNLIFYIKTAYSNSLTSPKWKNFKGLKLQVIEKIRLNNVIWRTWFEQYGNRHPKKKQRPLLCQFAITLEDQPAASARAAKLEGEYWKRKLGSITNEYKKWREISRKRIKSTIDGFIQIEHSIVPTTSYRNKSGLAHSSSNYNIHQSMAGYNQYNESNNLNYQNSIINNNNNHSFDYVNSNNNNSNQFYSNDTNFNNLMNNNSNNLNYNLHSNSNFYGQTNNHTTSSGSSLGSTSVINSNQQTNASSYHANKPFSNRYRSPSPGLFNDFDLFNFSSDTLFSTHCFEDPKDPINDSNINTTTTNNVNTYDSTPNQTYGSSATKLASSMTANSINQTSALPPPPPPPQPVILTTAVEPTPIILNTTENTLPIYIQSNEPSMSNKTITTINTINTTSAQMAQSQTPQQQPQSYITTDSSDLYNFNTLATVAAAQSPNSEVRSRKHNAFKQNISGKNLKAMNSGKLSNSLSQMSTTNEAKALSNLSIDNTKSSFIDNSLILNQNNNNNTNINASNSTNSNNNTNSINSRVNALNNNNNNQNASYNGSSNTIRNLLASQTPLTITNALNEKPTIMNSNNNLRLSTGVLSAVGGSLQSNNSLATRPNYNSINNLISNIQKQSSSSSSPSPASSISSPTNILSAPSFMDSKFSQQDNPQMSALLSAISAPPADNNNQKKANLNSDQTIGSKSKRGRKANNSNVIDTINENGYDRASLVYNNTNPQQTLMQAQAHQKINPTSMQQQQQQQNGAVSIKNIDLLKESKDKSGKFNNKQKQFDDKPSFYLQASYSDNQLCGTSNSRNLIINERTSSSNSPIDSPSSNPNHYTNNSNIIQVNSYNLMNGTQSADNLNDYNSASMQRCNSNSNLNYLPSSSSSAASLKTPMLNSEVSLNVQRSLSRSNSVNSLNTMNEQVSAEQKRRCNIQHGFDRLQTLVPSLRDGKNSKASKAAMLQKTSEYIKELQRARQKRVNDLDVFRKEIEQLSEQISECQNELPANGVSVVGNLNKTEKFEQKFKEYVKDRTLENWRFYLFSIILKPLFDNFIKILNTSSKEDIERTFHEWQEKYCNLVQLRPIISNSLRHLSKSTSILTDSNKLPEECYTAALTKI